MRKVPFTNYPAMFKKYRREVWPAMRRVLEGGRLILQQEVEDFEKNLAAYLGVKHVVGLNSGTDALWLALKAAGVRQGDEVITVSHTFVATIQTIAEVGAMPVLVDIREDGLMDPYALEKAITEKTKAIIPVHLSGDVCDMDRIMKIASERGIKVIEDAAQALGAEWWDGRKAGTIGLAGCFSFYPAKILGAFGDAGALATNDDAIAQEVFKIRNHYLIGKKVVSDDETFKFGVNSRLDNVWAKVLDIKLAHFREDILYRHAIASLYNELLKDIPELKLPSNRQGRVYQDYVIETHRRPELQAFLAENGIGTLREDNPPVHQLKGLGLSHFSLPLTEKRHQNYLRIPCNQFMSLHQAKRVAKKIRKFYGK